MTLVDYVPKEHRARALWLSAQPSHELAWLFGAVVAALARNLGMSQAALLAEWADRASKEPSLNVPEPPI